MNCKKNFELTDKEKTKLFKLKSFTNLGEV